LFSHAYNFTRLIYDKYVSNNHTWEIKPFFIFCPKSAIQKYCYELLLILPIIRSFHWLLDRKHWILRLHRLVKWLAGFATSYNTHISLILKWKKIYICIYDNEAKFILVIIVRWINYDSKQIWPLSLLKSCFSQ